MSIGISNAIFVALARLQASAGGRRSLAAMAAPSAPSGSPPQRLVTRRSTAMRGLDMQIRMR
jgi:hypothetical protein